MTVGRRRFVASAAVGASCLAALVNTVAASSLLRQSTATRQDVAQVQQAGAGDAEADALVARADAYQSQGDNRQALDSYQQALMHYRRHTNAPGEARALTGIASAYSRLSDYQQSIASYDQALGLYRAAGDRKGQAAALSGIGAARVRLNQYAEARAVLNESLPLYQALGDRAGEAAALQSIGYASFSNDDYATAIEVYHRALALARADAARGLEASINYNIGQVHYHLGDYQKALDLYTEALAVHRALGNRSGEAAALSALGRVYRFLGEYQQALDHHAQAVTILRAIGERMNEATSLNNTAHVYLSMGEYRKALPFFEQSLTICVEVGNQSGVASNTNGVGLVHAGLQDYERALPFHREALRLFRAIGHRRAEADSLGHLGRAYEGLGDHQQARAHLQDALAIYRAVRVPRQESETLYAMAQTERNAGELAAAATDIDLAIRIAEGFRHDVSSQQLRTSYQGTIRDFYELKIDVLMQQHRRSASADAQAGGLEASERARARSLLDSLAEARAGIRGDVDPRLLEREGALRQRLAGLAERQAQLVGGTATPDQLATISRQIETGLGDYENVLATIRASSPRYAALMQPEPLTLTQMQAEVLDADTVLLEYFLGADRSYVWAVTRDTLTSHELPRRAQIEEAARQFHDLLSANGPGAELQRSARILSDMVLAPLADRLRGRRLAIVADGALHYVPFAALPEPRPAGDGHRDQPLMVEHEVVNLPSASTLAVLRREARDRVPAAKVVAVVADPVFDASDVRVRRTPAQAAGPRHDPPPQWLLPRLLGTRREARAILALAPDGKRREALDFDASRETATDGGLAGYQVIHFATHALINNQHPELSGLVLSLVDRDGRAQDGFLRLNDVYNLRLPAELVVLSACRTGLGKEMRGEGLIGLTRGFMYAGTPRLITSLWQVDDAGTTELMARLYRGLLGDQRLTPAAALRAAQIELWRQPDWQSPYYWAAFALQGEWQAAGAGRAAR